MVDDAVRESRGPHFARLGPDDGEAGRGPGLVGSIAERAIKLAQQALLVALEFERRGARALGAPAIEIGGDQVAKREISRARGKKVICGRRGRGAWSSCDCCSGFRCSSSCTTPTTRRRL